MSIAGTDLSARTKEAKSILDAHVREIVEWHFNPDTGCPFWLGFAESLGWDPRSEIKSFEDLTRFPAFQDEWLRGGPVRRWLPKGLAGKPIFTFETGGSTRGPKNRLQHEEFCTRYEVFSGPPPQEKFPEDGNRWTLGPAG